jgi:hypothetical protein
MTRSRCASITRASAGTSSPSSTTTMSPGTSSARRDDQALHAAPHHLHVLRQEPLQLERACSAFCSCQNENAPLMTTTPRIAAPSVAMPWPGW